MTRKDVFLANINPDLQPIENWHLYKFIGNETKTSIYNNDYCPVSGEKFELMSYDSLNRLKPNNNEVTAYWLPEEDGTLKKVYLYQGDTYIGEALNRSNFDYNENAIEQDDTDKENKLHQQKRLTSFDKFIKDARADIPKVGSINADAKKAITEKMPEVLPPTPKQLVENEDDFEFATDWAKQAINNL